MPSLNCDTTYPPLVERVVVLTGPTASGKTALALEVAERLNGEILSLDSIAVYHGMDIGTAKPSETDRERVAHHMIDLVTPDEDYSVARYLQEAHRIVDDLAANGRKAIFVGGTPMFLKAVLRGFDPGPPPDWDFRKSVEQDLERYGQEALRRRLIQVDPLSAAKIDPGDTRRMIRALEVSKSTGRPLSHRQIQFERARPASSCCVFALQWPRKELHERINQRVDRMFEQGLIDEVKSLLEQYELSRTAVQAVGYREVIEWLRADQNGGALPQTVRESIAAHTRQLARRQETWFRSFSEISFLDASDAVNERALADEVVRRVEATQDCLKSRAE
ncbi:MAG: tRNA (adenosine(37)-N6)-dimethylallyltransferase MiaA [Planctomycetota bacterium]